MFDHKVTIFYEENICQEARQWAFETFKEKEITSVSGAKYDCWNCSRYVLFEGEDGYGDPENLQSNGSYTLDDISKFIFGFENEDDAVLFKLTWG